MLISISKFIISIMSLILFAVLLKSLVIELYRVHSISMAPTLHHGDFILVSKYSYKIETPRKFPLTNIDVPYWTFDGLISVNRGDIVLFKLPEFINGEKIAQQNPIVKRCIGLPGETIEINNNKAIINKNEVEVSIAKRYLGVEGNSYFINVPSKSDTIFLSSKLSQNVIDLISGEGHKIEIDSYNKCRVDGIVKKIYIIEQNYFFMMGDNRSYSHDSRSWGCVPEKNLIGEVLLF